MSALDDLLDKKDREIARLGSLLDDAVDLLFNWLPPHDEPRLAEKTAFFLSQTDIDKRLIALAKAKASATVQSDVVVTAADIRARLAERRKRRPPLTICPACGADYAEAEAKNARLAKAAKPADRGDDWREFYTSSDEVHDGSRRTQFAELEVVRLKEEHAVYAPAMVNLLDAGAVGTIVHVHQPLDPKPAYEVEFTDDAGKTIAVLTLRDDEIEKMT